MAATLINVRLNSEDAAKLRSLRRKGVSTSTLVRSAIRAEFARMQNGRRPRRDVRAILEDIYARFPIPDDVPPPPVDMRDRHARSDYIVKQIRARKHS